MSVQPFRWADPGTIALCSSAEFVDFYWVRLGSAQALFGDRSEPLRPADLLALHGNPAAARVARSLCGYHVQAAREFLRRFHSDSLFAPLRPFLECLEYPVLHVHFAAEERFELEWLLSRMMRGECRCDTEISFTSLRLLFGHFLLLCHRQWQAGQRSAKVVSSSGEDVVRTLQGYIDEHLSETFGLARLAQKAGYAPSYLSSIFTKATGQGLTEYICSNRIALARELLSNTRLKVMHVCYEVGFRDVAHFNRTFKRMVGVTPTQYRRLHDSRSTTGESVATSRARTLTGAG